MGVGSRDSTVKPTGKYPRRRLKNISDDGVRKEKLFKLLEFLGANPIQKIDKAFKKKFKMGIIEYLKITGIT